MFNDWSDKTLIGFPVLLAIFMLLTVGIAYGGIWIIERFI